MLIVPSCAWPAEDQDIIGSGPHHGWILPFCCGGLRWEVVAESLAESLPVAQGRVPQAYLPGLPPSVNASVLLPQVFC